MTPRIKSIAEPIVHNLEARARQSLLRRTEAMERELAFLSSREDRNLIFIRERGWTDERLQLLFLLNSVYQHVLGPIQVAARGGPEGLGGEIPVRHGQIVFDREKASRVKMSIRAFLSIVDELRFMRSWLYANTCADAVFAIATLERDRSRR